MKSALRILFSTCLAAGALLSPQTQADDIDLYTGGEAVTGAEVNVLIVFDNTSNFSASNQGWIDIDDLDSDGSTTDAIEQGRVEAQTVSEVVGSLGDSVNVGLMMYADDGGGYPIFAVRPMGATAKGKFLSVASAIGQNVGDPLYKGPSSGDYDKLLNSVFRYFNGFPRFLDTNSPDNAANDLRDYSGNLIPVDRTPLGDFGYSGTPGTNYRAPTSAPAGCAKNFVIFVGNGFPSQSSTSAVTQLTTAGALFDPDVVPVTTGIAVADSLSQVAPYWTKFMHSYGTKSVVDDPRNSGSKLWNNITTYAIDVCKNGCDNGSGPNQSLLLKSMAKEGGGKYFKSTSKTELKNAFAAIFAEIQAVNSVFASASLPVSVNTQGTFENQIYVGVFRPDAGSRPRWNGNLKEYKIGRFCDIDRDGSVRVDSTRPLVNGLIPATLTGTATGPVTGTFSGSIVNVAGVTTAVSGTVSGTISGTAKGTLAATFGSSAGTSGSPGDDLGAGAVTGTITGTGTGTGTSTFTGTLLATPSLSGTHTATDWRIGEDIPAPVCGTDASGKIPRLPYFADRNGNKATDDSGGTGFIDLQARSHWSSASNFWAASPSASAGPSDLPDGPEVERGAAAQRLRQTWATAATSPHQDGRKVYTCLGTCLAGAAAADKQLYASANAVYTTNSAVTTALTPPAGSATMVSPNGLVRVGNKVLATATAAHGFSDGATVAIAGATPTNYNSPPNTPDKIISLTDPLVTNPVTQFVFSITEMPTNDTATATKSGGTASIVSIVLSGTAPGTTVTATVTTTIPHGLAAGGTTTIAGAAQSFLNGGQTVLTPAVADLFSTVFTYSVTIPGGPPATPSATPGSSVAVGQSATHASISHNPSVPCVTGGPVGCAVVLATAALGTNFVAGNTVAVSGADAAYNGTKVIAASGTSCPNTATLTITNTGALASRNASKVYCYSVPLGTAATTPDGGASKTATIGNLSFPVNITRTAGSTTATAVTNPLAAHTFTTLDTITISGATQSQYNGARSPLSVPDANSFTFGPIALTPATPATGTITATTGTGIAGPDTTNLILWTRGKDLWEDEDLNGALTNARASIHADVLHSRPAVVNYGSSIGIVGFYGANDGFLRAIHGGTASVDGEEKWAFIPSEFMNYNKLARLYKNSNLVRFPNFQCNLTPRPTARDYFWDGPITVYQSPDGTASTPPTKSWLFAIMRRGGRSIYALDVSNPDTPKFMWRISNTHFNNTPSTTYAELGETWSEPQIVKLKGTFTRADATVVTNPVVLVFGAGYDAAQEDKPTGSYVSPTRGRGVFVVEAETGQLIQFLAPTSGVAGYSFAADPNVLDLNADGFADRIYAADTNANVFRFDTVQTVTDVASSSYWKRYHLAKVGDIDNNGGVNARKFLFKPETLPFTHNGVVKTMVLLGSGNREKPLNNFTSAGSVNTLPVCTGSYTSLYTDTYYATSTSNKVNDRFFGLLDEVQSGAVESTVNADPILLGDLQQINSSTVTNDTLTPFSLSSSDRGWQILLRNDPDGNGARNEEKTVNAGKVIGGVVFFATNTPVSPNVNAGICSNLGEARSYALDPITGMPAFNRDASTDVNGVATFTAADFSAVFAGGGLPPTAVSGTVDVGGDPVNICIGCGGKDSGETNVFETLDPTPNLTGIRTRLYWSYGAD